MTRQVLLFLLALDVGFSQLPPKPEPSSPVAAEDPFNRTSPQRAVISFLSAVRANNYSHAVQYLNTERVPRAEQHTRPYLAARMLAELLNREPDFNIGTVSNDPDGRTSDDLPSDRELLYTAEDGKLRIEMQRKAMQPNGPRVWVFTPETVNAIAAMNEGGIESSVEAQLPEWMVRWTLLRTPVWRAVALLLFVLIAAALSRQLSLLALRLARPVCRRLDPTGSCDVVDGFVSPLRLLVAATVFRALAAFVPISALGRFYVDRVVNLVTIIAIAWLVSRLMDVFVARFQQALVTRHSSLSRSVLPLVSRMAKGLILVFAVTFTLSSWGFNMTAALAGVGIGGIAIALAAQKTIENLFGGFAIITDGPVSVGDFCKFGDRTGTVEDIGLRSTRVRTADRTVVTIPNGEFSSSVLENFSRRDKIWFHPTLNLRKDTSPAQIRQLLPAIGEILSQHPKIEIGSMPVRFLGAGSFSLDIEVFAYVQTVNYDEYLAIQQELWLAMLDAVVKAGTAMALPAESGGPPARNARDFNASPDSNRPAQPRAQ